MRRIVNIKKIWMDWTWCVNGCGSEERRRDSAGPKIETTGERHGALHSLGRSVG